MSHDIVSAELSQDIVTLVGAAGLPTADLHVDADVCWLALRANAQVAAVIGLELYGPVALLRSLAVAPSCRSAGYGRALVEHAQDKASAEGVRMLYLLTDTAEGFFTRLGYSLLPRSAAPDSIRRTTQFSALCPASSAFMGRTLAAGGGDRPSDAARGML